MCQNAEKTAASMMQALEPELKGLLSVEGQLNTPEGQAAVAAYESAYQSLLSWTPGSTSTIVLESVQAFQSAFQAVVPLLPPGTGSLVNIILAGIVAVMGIIQANSPAPAHVVTLMQAEIPEHEAQHMYAKQVESATESQVQALVPQFKRSLFHSAASQVTHTWNKAVKDGNFPDVLHIS